MIYISINTMISSYKYFKYSVTRTKRIVIGVISVSRITNFIRIYQPSSAFCQITDFICNLKKKNNKITHCIKIHSMSFYLFITRPVLLDFTGSLTKNSIKILLQTTAKSKCRSTCNNIPQIVLLKIRIFVKLIIIGLQGTSIKCLI